MRVCMKFGIKTFFADLDRDQVKFTPYLWHILTDHADVRADGTVDFVFRDGE